MLFMSRTMTSRTLPICLTLLALSLINCDAKTSDDEEEDTTSTTSTESNESSETTEQTSETSQSEEEFENSTTGSLRISSLKKLPSVTDPVLAYSSQATGAQVDEAASFNKLQIGTDQELTLASTGIPLGSDLKNLQERFTSTSDASKNFCRTMNQAFRFMGTAAGPDLHACYVSQAFSKYNFIYDGDFHTLDLKITEEEDGEDVTFEIRFRVKIEVDENNKITLFEAKVCEAEEEDEPLKFIEYMKKTITENQAKIFAKSVTSFDNNGDEQIIHIQTEVTSSLNEEGSMVGLKTIQHQTSASWPWIDGPSGRSISKGNIL